MLVPRCVYAGLEEGVTLYVIHGFGDASETAYCAVVYLVLEVSGDFLSSFVVIQNLSGTADKAVYP